MKELEELKKQAESKKPETITINVSQVKWIGDEPLRFSISSSLDISKAIYKQIENISEAHQDKVDQIIKENKEAIIKEFINMPRKERKKLLKQLKKK